MRVMGIVPEPCSTLPAMIDVLASSLGGLIKEANGDRRFKMEGEVINFFVHYEIDDNTSRHVLKLDNYGGDGVDSWVLLEALA